MVLLSNALFWNKRQILWPISQSGLIMVGILASNSCQQMLFILFARGLPYGYRTWFVYHYLYVFIWFTFIRNKRTEKIVTMKILECLSLLYLHCRGHGIRIAVYTTILCRNPLTWARLGRLKIGQRALLYNYPFARPGPDQALNFISIQELIISGLGLKG